MILGIKGVSMKDNYKQGDRVKTLLNSTLSEGFGTICGIATTGNPFVGKSWIVKPDDPILGYEYSHIVLFSNMIEPYYDKDHPRFEVQKLDFADKPNERYWVYDHKHNYFVYDKGIREEAERICKFNNEGMDSSKMMSILYKYGNK
jgi:hypothetical protein